MNTSDIYSSFSPAAYLHEYYARVDGENDRLLAFHARAQALIPRGGRMLEFGGGPTLYQLISAAGRGREIRFVDYLDSNLAAVRCWLDDQPGAHDWGPFVERSLMHEGAEENVAERQATMHRAVVSLESCDAFAEPLVLGDQAYDVVASNFVAEGITSDHSEWERANRAIAGLVGAAGYLLMTTITGAAYWRVGATSVAATELQTEDIRSLIESLGFAVVIEESLAADVTDPADPAFEGYTGMYLVLAQRSDETT